MPRRERRAYTRRQDLESVIVKTADGALYPAQLRDVSPGGAYLRSEFLIPPCTPCQLCWSRGTVEAVVLRSHGDAAGIGMALSFDLARAGDELATARLS